MALTTLTVNGVDITTSETLEAVLAAIAAPKTSPKVTTPYRQPETADEQPKASPKVTKQQPKRPKAAKGKRTAKPTTAHRPKVDGKALWASITAAVAEGNYDEARRLAAPKPDTFGVQCEAAIARHVAKQAKPVGTKGADEQRTAKPTHSQRALPPKGEMVEPVVVLSETTKAKMAKANSLEAQAPKEPDEPKARKPRSRNHKPDCGCPTCPKGIAARRSKTADQVTKPEAAPKVTLPEAAKPIALQVRDDAAEMRECERIVAKGNEQAEKMLNTLDTEGLKEAIRNYNTLAKRNLRLGNEALAIAYDECLDTCSLALTMAKESMAIK